MPSVELSASAPSCCAMCLSGYCDHEPQDEWQYGHEESALTVIGGTLCCSDCSKIAGKKVFGLG